MPIAKLLVSRFVGFSHRETIGEFKRRYNTFAPPTSCWGRWASDTGDVLAFQVQPSNPDCLKALAIGCQMLWTLPTDPTTLRLQLRFSRWCSRVRQAAVLACENWFGKVELPSLRCLIFCWCYCWKIKGRDAMLFKLRSWGSQWTVAAVPRRRERMWEWWWWLERLLASVCRWEWWSPGLKFAKAFPRFIYCKFILSSSQLLISRLYPFVWLYQDFPSKSTP